VDTVATIIQPKLIPRRERVNPTKLGLCNESVAVRPVPVRRGIPRLQM